MMHFIKYIVPFISSIFLLFSCQISAAETDTVSDIRVLIDVSGSMKQNDPNNLRAPALRLIVGLMPENVVAGAWTFGEHVNVVVPHRKVNESWKLKAQQQSNKIHSRSLFTDMEQVLNKTTADQQNDNTKIQRNVILLSDGLVDISSDSELNQQSRQRILDELIPRLKQANIAIHSIALSDTADHELLRAMSLATDGWYEQVDNADALQRVFLHLFEKTIQRDTVPLNENQFKIDESVTEMTLLVFRQQGSKATELILPDQSRVTMDQLPANILWHNETNYDLITIESPIVGAWQIDANVDPDNRVMVVTDLKLHTTDLPNNILIGESFDFDANLTEKDQVIERQDFLKLVDVQLKEESEIADSIERSLNSQQEKGLYRTHVGDDFQPGRNDVVITMKSATFERQRRQSINVVEMPFEINVERLTDQETRTHRIILVPDTNLIKAENLTITAMLTAQDGSEWSYDVMKNLQQQWQLTLAELNEDDQYTVALQIKGETVKGRSLFLQPDPIALQEQPLEVVEDELIVEEESVEEQFEERPEDLQGKGSEILQNISGEVNNPMVEELVLDEMAEDVDELLLLEDELDTEPVDDVEDLAGEEASSTVKLAIGNGVILILVILAILLWRRSRVTKTNPGDLL
ncbi:MAG: VWA domain-containing protein [Methylophaga sp.]|nr:VWA domain-containing protein [Methylophaga sp.]